MMNMLISTISVQKSRNGRHAFEGLAAAEAEREAVFTSSTIPLRPVTYVVVSVQAHKSRGMPSRAALEETNYGSPYETDAPSFDQSRPVVRLKA